LARSTLGTVGIALAALIVLSMLGTIGAVHDWLPSTLSGAPIELLSTTQLSDYVPSLLTAIAVAALLVWLSVVGSADARSELAFKPGSRSS